MEEARGQSALARAAGVAAPRATRAARVPLNRATVGVASILLGLLLWELTSRFLIRELFLLAPPSMVMELLAKWFGGTLNPAGKSIYWHIYISLSEFTLGFVLGALVGVSVGILMAIFRLADWSLDPWVAALFATPTVALAPLFIVWLGVDVGSKVGVVFLVTSIPILINTQVGVQTADPRLIEAIRSFGAKRWQQIRIVLLPWAVPAIIGGMRIAVGRGLVGVVVGELFGARAGLGFLIYEANTRFDTASLFAAVTILAVMGVVFVRALDWAQRRVAPWREA
jgi:NitT/TauT family transport system permease protein